MRARVVGLTVSLCLLSFALAHAQGLPSAKPEEVGLSSERLNRAMAAVKADVEKGALPGAVLLVARHGKVVMFEAVGMLDPATKAPMTKDAIFRIYSMSKPITSVAAMMLFEEGKLNLGDPVSKYLPQMRDLKVGVTKPDPSGGKLTLELVPVEREMTIQDLLRHSAGLTYGARGDNPVKAMWAQAEVSRGRPSNAELIDRIAKLPLLYQPGTTWEYSHATDVLGRVVEVISDRSLYQFEKERILDPLGMKDTSFYVLDRAKQSRVAEPFPTNRMLASGNEMNDPRVEGKSEGGGGGMVGTTMDYARFSQMLLNGGTLNGKRLLGPKTVAYMASDHLGTRIKPGPSYSPGPGFGFGLGFAVRTATGEAPFAGSVGEFNWSGAAGTTFWIDPKEDMFVVFMIQDPKQGRYYRALLKDMIYAAVDKPVAK
jgi:CubicO group peptidase (beta-lactamase class C family)